MFVSFATRKWTITRAGWPDHYDFYRNGGDGSLAELAGPDDYLPEFGRFEGLKVAIAVDLDHSRVAKSNTKILSAWGRTLLCRSEEWRSQSLRTMASLLIELIK